MRALPIIRFIKCPDRRILIEFNGTTVGQYLPIYDYHRQSEEFMDTLTNLKHYVYDGVIDTFKYMDSIQKESQ